MHTDVTTPIPLVDLRAQDAAIGEEVRAAIDRVLAAQAFILGPEVEALEREIAAYCACTYAIGMSSGTDALLAALMALGVQAGDEVILPTLTWVSTGEVIMRVGARPVFVDSDPQTYTLDPAQLARAVTPRTRAIIPVHFYGQMADMDAITELADRYNLAIIEDAAQAIGAEYKGRRAGSIGHVGCFSFFPSKVLSGPGDGGMVTTNDGRLAKTLKLLRSHGGEPGGPDAQILGGNFRMDALYAAVLRAKLPHLETWIERRREIAAVYRALFDGAGLLDPDRQLVVLPEEANARRHVYYQYIIRAKWRDELLAHLHKCHIGSKIYYPLPLHLQTVFQYLGHKAGDFPVSERVTQQTLAIPMYPELRPEQMERVVGTIADYYAEKDTAAMSTWDG